MCHSFNSWLIKNISTIILVTIIIIIPRTSNAQSEFLDEDYAIHAVERYWTEWSRENSLAINFLRDSYATSVNYYGKAEAKKHVMKLKSEFAERWPDRTYSLSPASINVSCGPSRSSCLVTGRVYWDARSEHRGVRAVGLAEFELGILRSGSSFQIISEAGKVLENKTLDLTSDDGQSPIPIGTYVFPAHKTAAISSMRASRISKVVLYCFNQGNRGNRHITIQGMFDCSGVWVTPKALLRCSLGTQCPVLPDTLVGRATLAALLDSQSLHINSILELRSTDLPLIPSRGLLTECQAASSTEEDFQQCVTSKSTSEQYASLTECIRNTKGVEQARCLTTEIKDPRLDSMATCLNGRTSDASRVMSCLQDPAVTAKAEKIRDCGAAATDLSAAANCLASDLPDNQKPLVQCLATPQGKRNPAACLEKASPDVARASNVVKCLDSKEDASDTEVVMCVSKQFPGDTGKVAACVNNSDRVKAARCLLGDTPELKAAERLYRCASAGYDPGSLIENCTTDLGLDPRTQQTLACAARSDGDRSKLMNCAAQAVLPPEAARYVSCAASSQGPTSFTLCAAAPKMNEEWRIAAECAVQSGGQPYAAAACAVTRLTIRELTKCFEGGIGDSCFGPNNTLIQAVNTVFSDLLHGPGKNNDIVKAIDVIGESIQNLSKKAEKFAEKPLGGENALIPKARDDLLNATGIGGSAANAIKNPLQPWKW